MADRLPISSVIGLPPTDTVRAFEARDTLHATVRWSEMWQEEHARAFTVAKIAKLDLLAEVQAAVADVIANGGTFEQFRANVEPMLVRAGWWGQVNDAALTGTADTVNVGPHRLRTIYDTNLRVSRAAGRWRRIQELKAVRPYLRYTAVLDARTRPAHRAWHGTILPVDDEWWDTHYPPCGWFCRCSVMQLSERDLARHGWSVTARPPMGTPQPFLRAGSTTPVLIPEGISPGFGYNAGKASLAAIADKAIRSLEQVAPTDLAAARSTLDELVQSDAFLETLNEPGAAFPVMILDQATIDQVGATSRVAVLSTDTYQKQLGRTDRSRGHVELTISDYRQLPQVGADADIFAVEGDNVLKLVKQADGSWLVAVVKRTSDGRLFVTSVRRQREASLKTLLANTRIIYDRRN